MNLIDEIQNYFNEHKDFDDFTKLRYIYLKICKTFSYDLRFYQDNDKLKTSIYNEEINVENVKKREYVCSSISNALIDVLNWFGYDAYLQKEDEKSKHVFTVLDFKYKDSDYKIKMDPTKRHDLTRVKLDSPTIDFVDLNNGKYFYDDLAYSDNLIRSTQPFVDHEVQYDTITLKELNTLINENAKKRGISDKELFNEKVDYIMCLINTRNDLKTNDDMDYYYSYITRNFDIDDKSMNNYLRTAPFFNRFVKDYSDMIWLTDVCYENTYHYMMVLKNENGKYKLEKISKEKAIEYLNEYSNDQCQYIFENWTASLDDRSLNESNRIR